MTKSSLRRLAWLYSALLVVLVVLADRGALDLDLIARLPGGDKTGHFLLMGLLCLLVNLAFATRDRSTVVWRSLLVASVVALEEVSQVVFRYRHFEWADLAADLAGIAIFASLLLIGPRARAGAARSRRGSAPSPPA